MKEGERERERETDRQTGQTDRDTKKSKSKTERGRESEKGKKREKNNMLGTYYATKWNETSHPKVSPCLPSISSTNTSHSIKE